MSTTDGQKQMQKPAALSAHDAEIKKVFSRFDADGDGRISPSELAAVAGAISPPPSESVGGREVGAMMEELDADRDGFVDLGEFQAFHGRGGAGRDLDAELRDAFDVYDINGDGRISAAELSKVLGRIGEGCSAEECDRMIASVGVDGYVGFQEFKKMMAPLTAPPPSPPASLTSPNRSLPRRQAQGGVISSTLAWACDQRSKLREVYASVYF